MKYTDRTSGLMSMKPFYPVPLAVCSAAAEPSVLGRLTSITTVEG